MQARDLRCKVERREEEREERDKRDVWQERGRDERLECGRVGVQLLLAHRIIKGVHYRRQGMHPSERQTCPFDSKRFACWRVLTANGPVYDPLLMAIDDAVCNRCEWLGVEVQSVGPCMAVCSSQLVQAAAPTWRLVSHADPASNFQICYTATIFDLNSKRAATSLGRMSCRRSWMTRHPTWQAECTRARPGCNPRSEQPGAEPQATPAKRRHWDAPHLGQGS